MSEWTKENVKRWLLSIGIPDPVANKFYDGDVHGKVLEIYRKEHLMEDFNVAIGNARLILHHRDKWLDLEKQTLTTPSSGKSVLVAPAAVSPDHSERLSPDAVEESVRTGLEGTLQPAVRPKIPMSHPAVKKSTRKKKPTQTDKEPHAPYVEKSKSEDSTEKDVIVSPRQRIKTSPAPSSTGKSECDSDHDDTDLLVVRKTPASLEVAPFQISHGTPQNDVPKNKSSVDFPQSPRPPKPRPALQPSNEEGQALMQVEGKSESVTKIKPPTSADKTSQDTQTNEARLRTLLTGDDRGDLDQLSYPLLVANKTPTLSPACSRIDYIRQRFGFIKTIRWTTALDFDSDSLSDGLCKLYHDDRMVTLQQPDLFRDIESEEDLRNKIRFPEKTLWLFANGREDHPSIHTPHMDLQEWNKERSRDVEASISFFAQPSVIPKGRASIVFLLMSNDDLGIICDIFRKIASSFKGLDNITCIAEDENVYSQFAKGVEKWFTKSELDERSLVGLEWQEIDRIIMRMSGVNQINASQLPTSTPGKCFLSEKQKDEWDDITVVCKNECENTDMDESSQGYQKFAGEKELNFYRGEQADWWNFAIGEREEQIHKSCGHVLKRKGFGEVLKKVKKPLESSKVEDSLIVTVTLLHQPGAGGSTLARHVLWQLHKDVRCIVVNRITSNTVNQVMEARKYGYTKEKAGKIPPVCVLIDNFDDLEVLDLIGDLEEASKGIHLDGGAVCVLLHCKRNMDPYQMIQELSRNQDLYIPLTHKLYPKEKEWFQKKYSELERKESEFNTGDYNPDNLLAFMVMKEEFNKEYIKRVVSEILHHGDIKSNEISLIKYCAFLNTYMHEAEIPISCCDVLMETQLKSRKTTYLTKKHTKNWEKSVSASFKIIVVMTENRTLKIFHKSIAEEALRQTQEMSGNQSVKDVALEFLNSELLRSPSHSKKDLKNTVHNLLIRRIRLGSADNTKTDFSGLIEDVYKQKSQGPEKAAKILETGLDILNDAFIAQHLARLYLKEGNFQMAHASIDKALEINPKKPYFWDTKGRISQKHLKTLSAPCLGNQQVLDKDVSKEIINLSFSAIDAFRKSFDFSKETMQMEFSALYAHLNVAFELLHVISVCVEPFRSSKDGNAFKTYLLNLNKRTDEYPQWDQECDSQIRELKSRVDSALDIMDNTLTYYKDGSSANIVGEKLEEMREELNKYSNMYEKYYGEPVPFDTCNEEDPKSLAEHRRRVVINLHCSRFGDIFNLAEENKRNLEKSRQLLLQNSSNYTVFDLKILVFIHLALLSSGKEYMSADEVYAKFVRPLNDGDRGKTDNRWAPFLMMMFLWPIQDSESERRDREDVIHYIEKLKIRADGGHNVKGLQMSRQEKSIGHTRFNMKPRTHFFLGRGQGLKVFVHINEILATQSKLERREFWQSSTVKDRLVRLEGILLNNTSLVYGYKKDKKIIIKLAVPSHKHTQSQESVTFYLGFSWSGPVAYSVTPKGKESCDDNEPRHFHKAYPKHILPRSKSKASSSDDTSQIDRLQKKCQELHNELLELQESLRDRKLKSLEKKEITRRITAKQRELDRKSSELMHAWQKETYDDG
ncbi:sterile alpha motif domain-containing protein 9-like [Patiria miniata]|uniref:SAM domain-containing protein n=1 Tax=Patiria miniata TaxID=46514 RepID=A0A913Z6R3_PATMI|nr:sterile alpha motif domain-containing protein 9-like [Patiria miniata]